MPEIRKFIIDDHARVRRTINDYYKSPWSLDDAMNVHDTLRLHLALEDEIIAPLVWRQLNRADATLAEDEHAEIEDLMARVASLQPDEPGLARAMDLLIKAFSRHVRTWERAVLPLLASEDIYGLGAQAYRRRQELFNESPPRTWRPMDRLANTGWGGGGKLANAGW